MRSSPRSSRGTSVIAALVFAALLGAVALGIHTFQNNSANTVALPAADAPAAESASGDSQQPTGTIDQQCTAGMQYFIKEPTGATQPSVANRRIVDCTQPPGSTYAKENAANYDMWCIPAPGKGQVFYQCSPTSSGTDTTGCKQKSCDAGDQLNSTSGSAPPSTGSGAAVVTPDTTGGLNGLKSCNTDGADPSTCIPPGNYTFPTPQGGGQIINCDTNESACPAQTSPNDPNTYCYNNLSTCYPPDSQLSTWKSDGWTCPTNPEGASECYPTSATQTPPAQSPCQNGQTVSANGSCGPATQTPPPNTPAPQTPAPQTPTPSQQSSANPLTSFLSGLAKGLTSPCTSAPQSQYVGVNGSTLVPQQIYNPTTATYSTVYVQQSTSPTGSQPCGQQAPYGVGSNGVACSVPPAQPTCATGATAMPIYGSGNGCVTSYQCVSSNGSTFAQTPTPQISCSPQVADVGMSVAISYSCANATGSSGSGFSTNNQTSGSTSTAISAPPSGTNTANFGLTCTNGVQTASAQCSVQITQPAIVLVANPQTIQSGQTSSIGWVTAGMQACVISSPQDATFTSANASDQSVNGVAQTDALTQNTEFDLTCTTLGGQTKVASTIVSTGTGTATSTASDITTTSTADGATVNHGDTVTITWSAPSAPSNSAVSLWLMDLRTDTLSSLIASDQPTSGSYQWTIPNTGDACDSTSWAACASDLVAARSYGFEVGLYTPSDAYIGPTSAAPSGAASPTYSDYGYTQNSFTIGQ